MQVPLSWDSSLPISFRVGEDVMCCAVALSLRADYLEALDADTEAGQAASVLRPDVEGTSRARLYRAMESAHSRLLQARRLYWEHVEKHACGPESKPALTFPPTQH
jgi:hypothetical protein